jgi:hypothetical protein
MNGAENDATGPINHNLREVRMSMLCARCVFTFRNRILGGMLLALLMVAGQALADGHTLSGTVYGGSSPLPNTQVEALNAGTSNVAASATTDGSGHYSLMLTDGPYNLHVTPPAGSGFVEATTNISMSGADQTSDVILLAPAGGGGAVSGTVRGLNGNPLPNIWVYAYATQTGQYIASAQTDAAGHYSLTSTSTNIRVYMTNNGYSSSSYAPNYWEIQRYNIAISSATTVDVSLPVALLSGTVKGKNGAILANASVSASVSSYDSATQTSFYSSAGASSASDGAYSMLLITGSGSINVYPPNDGYWPLNESVAINGDTTHDLVLDVRENSTISGTVRGDGNNPLANIWIYAYSQTTGQYLGAAQSDANGFYSLSAANGTIRMYATNNGYASSPYAPGYWELQRYGITVAAATTVDITLTVSRTSGTVKGKDGATLANTSVSASSSSYDAATQSSFYSSTSAVSGTDGHYSLLLVNGSGSINVYPPNDGYWPLNESFTFSGEAVHDLLLDVRQNSTVSGTIRGAGGNPLSNIWVYAYSQNTGQYLAASQSDSNGYYSLSAANGTVRIYATNNGYSSSSYAPGYWELQRYNNEVNGPTTVDIDLPTVTVSGIANDSNGIGVPNVSVSASTSTYDSNTSTSFYASSSAGTSSDGTYTLVLMRGSGGFNITPPPQSGFTSANLSVNLNGDLTQRIILQHPDLIPPQIVAGPVVVHLSATSVSVSWTTNEASTSRVEYGIGGMGTVVNDTALVTKHEVTLQNLALASTYQFRVGSSDAVGNGPTYSNPDTFATQAIADSTPPRITDGPTVAFVDQTSAIIQWTTDEPATTNLAYGATQSLGTAINGAASRFTVSHSIRITGLSAQTAYYAQVSSADPDNNSASSSIFSFTTLAAPDVNAPIIIAGPSISSTTDTKLTIVWTTDEPATSGVSYNDGTHFDLVSDATLTRDHQITISGLTASTTYFIRVSSSDANGNGPTLSGTISATTAATPDTTPPAITDLSVVVTTSSATVRWSTNEAANSIVRFGRNAGSYENTTADVDNELNHEITLTGLAENTTYYFVVSSTDASGNTSSQESSFLTGTSRVDQAPTAPGPLTAPRLTNSASIALAWGASTDDVAIAKYEVLRNGEVIATLSSADTSFADSGAGEGSYAYAIRATDSAGHTATSDTATVIVDRTAPVITAANVTAEAKGPQTAVSYTASGSDNVDASVNVVCSPSSASSFPVGTTTVSCSATDAAGNTGHASFDVIVKDTTAPCINIPSSVSKEAASASGAAVTFTASAKDLVDGAVATSCSPASGSTFAVGTTSVSCTATDAAANKATRSFDVHVVDTTAPVVHVPAAMTAEATSNSGAAVTFVATATDAVSGSVSVACAPASGSTFPIGGTTVKCIAMDAAGNKGANQFTVTVRDTTAPVVTVPKDITLEASNANGAMGIFTASATDAVSGNIAPVCSPASGSMFAIGTTTVNCTAKDAAGNTGTASFKVIVKDTTGPAIIAAAPNQSTLWPPDHRMVPMTVAVSASDQVSAATCRIAGIVSNEVIDGLGDGDTAPDWAMGNGLSFQLRAERAAKGSGRIYTIKVDCGDAAGNHSMKSVTVSVPKNQK